MTSSQGSSVGVLLGYSDSASLVQDAWVFGTATTKMPGRVYTGMFAGSAAKDTLRRVYSTGSLQGYGYMGMRDNAYSTASLDTAAYAGFDFAKTWYAAQGLAQPYLRAFLKPLAVTAKDTSRTYTGAVTGSFRSTFAPAGYEAGQVLGSLTYSGNAVTAVNPGTYALVPAGLYSTQRGYAIGYVPGSMTILPEPTGIASRPVAIPRSRELAARTSHPFASVVSGQGAGRLGADLTGCTDNSCLSLELALPSASSVRVSIFDQLGTPVISWNEVFTASDLARIGRAPDGRAQVRLSWNLRASNGAAVAPGVYLWKVEALTADGQKLETVKRMGVK